MGTEQQQRTGDSEQQQNSGESDQQQRTGDSDQQQRTGDSDQQPEQTEFGQLTEKPEVTDEHKEKAKDIAKAYNDDLQTTTLPGSGGTVSGTAVTDWVDDEDKGKIETSAEEGKVEYRNTEEFKKIQES
jgi:hypothetical protein